MYWSRTGSFLDLAAWAAICLLTWAGGWLICTHIFRLRSRERPGAGLASGALLLVVFSNLFGQALSLTAGFWLAALLVSGIGGLAAWRSSLRPRIPWKDWLDWPQLAFFAATFLLFLGINRGLAILDEHQNLPLVSMIAAGDLPPHFFLNPGVPLDYHYGLILLSAGLTRLGGFFAWSAFDILRAFALALVAWLAGLWYRRYLRSGLGLVLAVLLVMLAGGTRWLLLLLPTTLIDRLGQGLQLLGSAQATGPDLHTILISAWKIEGGGPFPFPFAFTNGLQSPTIMALGGNGALPFASLFLLLLLARRKWSPAAGLIYGLLLASLALTSEYQFLLCWGGIALAAVLRLLAHLKKASKTRPRGDLFSWGWPLLPGALLAPLAGGILTAIANRWISGGATAALQGGTLMPQLALRWPPAILSGHLGALSLFSPSQALVALLECGLVLLLAPLVTLKFGPYLRSGKLFHAGLALMAVAAFCVPIVLRFTERERDLARTASTAMNIWLILGIPYVWKLYARSGRTGKAVLGLGYAVAILAGLAMLPAMLITIARPTLTYFATETDAAMSKRYRDRLEPGAWVLDPAYPFRPAVLFARTSGPAYQNNSAAYPAFDALRHNPVPLEAAKAGYRYLYIDRETWQALDSAQRQAFENDCVRLVQQVKDPLGDFRRLYDVSACRAPGSASQPPGQLPGPSLRSDLKPPSTRRNHP